MKNFLTVLFCLTFLFANAQQKEVFSAEVKITSTAPDGIKGDFIAKGKKVALLNPKDIEGLALEIIDNRKREHYEFKKFAGRKGAVKTMKSHSIALSAGPKTPVTDWSKHKVTKIGSTKDLNDKMKDQFLNIKSTKETKTINGYNCTKVTGKDGSSSITAWVAKDIKIDLLDFVKDVNDFPLESQITNKYNGIPGLILEMSRKDLATGMSYTTKLEITKKEIGDHRFDIPESYMIVDANKVNRKIQTQDPSKPSRTSRALEFQKKVREQQSAAAQEVKPAPSTKGTVPSNPPAPAEGAPQDQ